MKDIYVLGAVWAGLGLAIIGFTGCDAAGAGGGGVAAVGAAMPGSGSGSGIGSGTGAAPTSTPDFQTRVLELTNAFRAQNGVAPLQPNPHLATAAQTYAELMAAQNWFAHNSPDGTTPDSRMTAAGYVSWTTWGENIAEGYATPEDVVGGWINSPGHRANMLNAAFKDIGIGVASSASSGMYWVQDFGAQ